MNMQENVRVHFLQLERNAFAEPTDLCDAAAILDGPDQNDTLVNPYSFRHLGHKTRMGG